MTIQIISIICGFISIFLYGFLLTNIEERDEFNLFQYIGSIVFGLCAIIPFIGEEIDFLVYLWIGFYLIMIFGTLFSKYFNDKEE